MPLHTVCPAAAHDVASCTAAPLAARDRRAAISLHFPSADPTPPRVRCFSLDRCDNAMWLEVGMAPDVLDRVRAYPHSRALHAPASAPRSHPAPSPPITARGSVSTGLTRVPSRPAAERRRSLGPCYCCCRVVSPPPPPCRSPPPLSSRDGGGRAEARRWGEGRALCAGATPFASGRSQTTTRVCAHAQQGIDT